ncbi:MAG: hypothetical protein KDD22_02880 [Bdellovibrionales bacterium]|nr:hypothetical protein [Bdellovibrionales bacterium]
MTLTLRRTFSTLFLFLVLAPCSVLAFVENVTHGYANCVTCHVSPSGGGLLTPYGRSLSKELISTWGGWENSEQPLFGLLPASEKILTGGDIRTSQTFRENSVQRSGRFFLMQNNFELGIPVGKVTAVGTFGTQEGPRGTPERGEFLSERHYLLWEISDNSRLRVGKFRQPWGINDPNHTRLVKSLLGFGALSETYNLEMSYFQEKYEVVLNTSLGRVDQPRTATSEKSFSANFVHFLEGNSQVGINAMIGESEVQHRFLTGGFAVLPFTKSMYGLFELDYETVNPVATPTKDEKTIVSSLRLGNEFFKGFRAYGIFEHASKDAMSGYVLTQAPGVGWQWLPFPHIELQMEYERKTVSNVPREVEHVGWLIFHLYPL